MMSRSHCFRNRSLSKDGSTLRISVSTSDISVLENNPPGKTAQWGGATATSTRKRGHTSGYRAEGGTVTLGTTPALKLNPGFIPPKDRPPTHHPDNDPCKALERALEGAAVPAAGADPGALGGALGCPCTYEVGDAVGDGAGGSDEGVVTLVVLHLHLKEPWNGSRESSEPGNNLQDPTSPQSLCSAPGTSCELLFSPFFSPFYSPFFSQFSCNVLISQ